MQTRYHRSILVCAGICLTFVFAMSWALRNTWLNMFQSCVFPKGFNHGLDYPLSGPTETLFPLDCLISYNTTNETGGFDMYTKRARYAAFSPVLNNVLQTKYGILLQDACGEMTLTIDEHQQHNAKALIVLRGNCSFEQKVSNILRSSLTPSAVIIANDEPHQGLMTMIADKVKNAKKLNYPVLFISNEDYVEFLGLENFNLTLYFSTASFGGWFNIVLSLTLSPPLFVITFYILIFLSLRAQRYYSNRLNARIVNLLPIYIYNKDHLIEKKYLDHYLAITSQSLTQSPNSSTICDSAHGLIAGLSGSFCEIVINSVDIRTHASDLHVLTSPQDYFVAYKCSICLESYVELKSLVLILECRHFFHQKCLANWILNFRKSCPLCNRNVDNSANLHHGNSGFSDDISARDLERNEHAPLLQASTSINLQSQCDFVQANQDSEYVGAIRLDCTENSYVLVYRPTETGQHFSFTTSDAHTSFMTAKSILEDFPQWVQGASESLLGQSTALAKFMTPTQSIALSKDDTGDESRKLSITSTFHYT